MTQRSTQDHTRDIKHRMRERLDQIGWTQRRLATEAGERYRNVNRWLTQETVMPAGFITSYVRTVPVDAKWLVTGEGTADPAAAKEVERGIDRRGLLDGWLYSLKFYNSRVRSFIQAVAGHVNAMEVGIEASQELLRDVPRAKEESPEMEWFLRKINEAAQASGTDLDLTEEQMLAIQREFLRRPPPQESEGRKKESAT